MGCRTWAQTTAPLAILTFAWLIVPGQPAAYAQAADPTTADPSSQGTARPAPEPPRTGLAGEPGFISSAIDFANRFVQVELAATTGPERSQDQCTDD